LSEPSRGDLGFEIGIGGGDQAELDFLLPFSSEGQDAAGFQYTQQLGLEG
jgi:hypothetical protein